MMRVWRRPLYGVGAVPPTESQRNCVAFVCAERNGSRTPVGTAFLISVGEGPRLFRYFVTARHVVEDGNPKWIRFRGANGAPPVDKSVDRWVSHSTSDIAIAPCDLDLGAEKLIAFWQEDKFFCDVFPPGRQIEPGADAYFIGLLSEIRGSGGDRR